MTIRTTPLTFRAAKTVLRCRPGIYPAAMEAQATDLYHAAMVRSVQQIRETELVTDVIDARTEPEGSDTPEANRRADNIMGACIWLAALGLYGWLA